MRSERLACIPVQAFHDSALQNSHRLRSFACGTGASQYSRSEFCRAAEISFGARLSAEHQSHTVRSSHCFVLLTRRGFPAELLRLVLRTQWPAGLIAAVTGRRNAARPWLACRHRRLPRRDEKRQAFARAASLDEFAHRQLVRSITSLRQRAAKSGTARGQD